ncbi:MAG: PAS domain S-box protein [Candidatus Aminicenantes bacterium]|nr:PAS domain S-box protein [Candidatus Aminicenantes bacterium]
MKKMTKAKLEEEVERLRMRIAELEHSDKGGSSGDGDPHYREAQYRGIFEASTDAFLIFDMNGVIRDVNPAACKMYGYSREEMIGLTGKDIVHPDYQHLFKEFVKKVAKGDIFSAESVDIHKDGSSFDIEVRGSGIIFNEKPHLLAVVHDLTEHKKIQGELMASLKKFEDIAGSSGDWIWEVDAKGKYTFASGRVEQILGYSPEDLIGKTPFDLMPGEEAARVSGIFERIATEKKAIVDLENWNLSKDGKLVCLLTNGVPLTDEDGNLTGYRGVDKDITKRKRTEEEIRTRNRIAEVFLTIPDDKMYYELMQVFLSSIKSEFGTLGYIDENGALVVPSMTWHMWDQSRTEDKNVVFPREEWGESSWSRCLKEQKTIVSNESSRLTPKGHIAITRHVSQPIVHKGVSIGLIQVANKETDYNDDDIKMLQTIADAVAPVLDARLKRDRAEKELRKHRDHLEELIEERTREITDAKAFTDNVLKNAPVGILVYQKDGQCVSANDLAPDLIGATREQVLGQNLRKIASWQESGMVARAERCLESGESQQMNVSVKTTFGKDIDMDVHFARFRLHEEPHLLLIFSDITNLKRTEKNLKDKAAQLEAANRELEAFAYSVSHDLRAPLRGMDGFSKILLEDYGDKLNTRGKDFARRVRTASQKMSILIDDILKLSRVTQHKIKQETVDLSGLARQTAELFRKIAPQRQAEFVIEDGIVAGGDAHLLSLVLQNLLDNAWKFTQKKEKARIEFGTLSHVDCEIKNTEIPDNETVYFVRDNGAGFETTYADKLFQPFQRLHSETEFEGTGIGLATVQNIIHRHGGKVWAKGKVGKGAVFYFTLGSPDRQDGWKEKMT